MTLLSSRRKSSPPANPRSPFRGDERGAATLEFVLIFPALVALLALIVFAGEGFEINRKVTMTVRTLTDLVTQQSNIGTSCTASTCYTPTQILCAASLVMAPYIPSADAGCNPSTSPLSMVISEIDANGSGTGTVVWSQATANGTALTVGASVTVPSNITTAGNLILGSATYTYNPLNVWYHANSMTLSDSLYLAPRVGTGVSCCN